MNSFKTWVPFHNLHISIGINYYWKFWNYEKWTPQHPKCNTLMCFHMFVRSIFLSTNELYTLALHTSVKETLYVLFHFKLIESPPYSHFCGLVSTMPCHGHVMLLLDDSLLAHRFGIASISLVFPSRWCLSPFLILQLLSLGWGFFHLGIFLSIQHIMNYIVSLGLWINCTFNNAKVLCHFSYFTKALGWVSKYFKKTLSLIFLVLCILR